MNDAQRPVATTSGKSGASGPGFPDTGSASIPGAPASSLPQPVSISLLPGALLPASPLLSEPGDSFSSSIPSPNPVEDEGREPASAWLRRGEQGRENRLPTSAAVPISLALAWRWAQGKKTYATAAAVLFLLVGQWRGWWNLPAQLYLALLALGDTITRGDHASRITHQVQAKEGPKRVLQAYGALVARNSAIRPDGAIAFEQKGQIAKEMAALYAREIRGNFKDYADMPLLAADFTDPAGNLGTLSGTLVAQRTLELFKLQFPAIKRVYTDFSDSPAQFKQTEATRIVVVPAIVSYSTTPDATGRPQGWVITQPAQTLDVLVTLDEHIGVPIMFDANMLASTVRRLFDEQAPVASYAFAKYYVEKIYKLMTPANFNAYAVKNGAYVPNVYNTFVKAQNDFARSSLVQLATIFNPNEVPIGDRTCLLNSPYYGQLATDPSLVTFFAGQRSPEIVTDNELPKLGTFLPVEAPNLANTNPTPNLAGFAMHKAAIVAKSRLSNDYTQALPGSSYGSVTTITDPDLGISVVLVQYVNHTGGYAEWRIQAMLGAAVGDKRGGLCITSQ